MRKIAQKHIQAINLLMQTRIAVYINNYVTAQSDVTNLQMYADDIAYNATALQKFNSTQDATSLHNAIMLQDTLVREHFYIVLKYIESAKLVDADMFACK